MANPVRQSAAEVWGGRAGSSELAAEGGGAMCVAVAAGRRLWRWWLESCGVLAAKSPLRRKKVHDAPIARNFSHTRSMAKEA